MNSTLNIVHVINSLDPRSGGPNYALRGLVRCQVERGHNVYVVATDIQAGVGGIARKEFREQILGDSLWQSINLSLLQAWGRGRPWNHFGFAPAAKQVINRVLRQLPQGQTIVHVHGVFSYLNSVAMRICLRKRISYLLEPYGVYDHACFRSNFWALKVLYHFLFTRWELKYASAVRAASDFEASPLRKLLKGEGAKVVSIPYGVDLPPIVDTALSHCGDDTVRCVGFLSRLAEKKRPEWVIYACERLRHEFRDLRVWIAGSDDGHRRVVERTIHDLNAQSWVRLDGFLAGAEKTSFFRTIAVLALPSKDESLGAVVLESLAHGVPAVVTPGVAAHTYVDASGCGVTVADSVDALAKGIRGILLADKRQLGLRGRQFISQHLTWQAIANQIENVYRQIVCRAGEH